MGMMFIPLAYSCSADGVIKNDQAGFVIENIDEDKPDWRWEGGFTKNTITDAENIRDQNLRAIFGNCAYLKNNNPKYAYRKLT